MRRTKACTAGLSALSSAAVSRAACTPFNAGTCDGRRVGEAPEVAVPRECGDCWLLAVGAPAAGPAAEAFFREGERFGEVCRCPGPSCKALPAGPAWRGEAACCCGCFEVWHARGDGCRPCADALTGDCACCGGDAGTADGPALGRRGLGEAAPPRCAAAPVAPAARGEVFEATGPGFCCGAAAAARCPAAAALASPALVTPCVLNGVAALSAAGAAAGATFAPPSGATHSAPCTAAPAVALERLPTRRVMRRAFFSCICLTCRRFSAISRSSISAVLEDFPAAPGAGGAAAVAVARRGRATVVPDAAAAAAGVATAVPPAVAAAVLPLLAPAACWAAGTRVGARGELAACALAAVG
mmetsp:Transcript_40947/g.130108  ORF Transcript_40947/g.130108 Transcript_40947/m.130108 type:complete len:357 (-) Transcript_40947:481-1551(-)